MAARLTDLALYRIDINDRLAHWLASPVKSKLICLDLAA